MLSHAMEAKAPEIRAMFRAAMVPRKGQTTQTTNKESSMNSSSAIFKSISLNRFSKRKLI
jgi:hypothetical protein